MIAQHPDGRVRGTRPESRSNSKLWGRLTAHFSRKESEGDRSNADGRVSITAGTGTTAGFWLVPFPQCPEASLGPFGNTEKPGKRVGRFAVDPGKDGTGSDDDNFRFFLESLRAVGRDGSRSHTHHCWRRRQWCASRFGLGRDGRKTKICRPWLLPTARGKRIKINHPRSKRRVVCLSIKPAELFFVPPSSLDSAFTRAPRQGERSGHHPPVYLPLLTDTLLGTSPAIRPGLPNGTVKMWG